MFLRQAFLSVSHRMMKGSSTKSGDSWITAKAEISRIASGEAAPPGATSLHSVVTGTPTAPKPVATVLPMRATKAENIGLKPRPMRMAAGMATAVPKPAMPSSSPPKPQTSIRTSTPRSSVNEVNCCLMTSICFDSTRML